MKKIFMIFLTVILILNFSCKKQTQSTDTTTTTAETTETVTTSEATDQFLNNTVWVYANTDDIGKAVKTNKLMEFGNKVSITDNKKIGDVEYKQIQLPDKSKYWVEKSNLSEKFITINQPDVVCYKQPDSTFAIKGVKLQPGDFFNYLGEQDGFLKVASVSYLPRGKDNSVVWLGEIWIKDGFSEDIAMAKDAFQLAQAYNILYGKNPDKAKAIEKMKSIISDGAGSDLTGVVQNIVNGLESGN
jgi:hypothetical protein